MAKQNQKQNRRSFGADFVVVKNGEIKPETKRRSSGADFVGIKVSQRAPAEIYYLSGLKISQ